MKKLLLASTALVLSAGLAHSQALNITGHGRMGILYDSTGLWGASNYRQENRLQFNFNVAVEGDHGLTFGAYSRARISNASIGVFSGSRVWVEASGLRLTFGNQDGAIQTAGLVGAVSIGYTGGTFAGGSAGMWIYPQAFSSTGTGAPHRASVSYSMGDVTAMLSYDRAGTYGVGTPAVTELGVNGTFGAFSAAVGYASSVAGAANSRIVTVSGAYNGGSWTVGAIVADLQTLGTNYALTGTAQLGGGTARAYIGRYIDGAPATSDNAWGLAYHYGLGGGASVAGGVERINGVTTGNVGVVFNF